MQAKSFPRDFAISWKEGLGGCAGKKKIHFQSYQKFLSSKLFHLLYHIQKKKSSIIKYY